MSLQSWLDDENARRNIFVVATVYNVIAATEQNILLSNCAYMTADALSIFLPIISGNFAITESLNISGGYSISYGDIELFNTGEYDDWLDHTKYIWVNRPIQVYVGDSSWIATDFNDLDNTFYLIFNGVIADIDCKSLTSLSIKVRDRQQDINAPVTEELMDTDGTWNGQQPNEDSVKPLVFGEVHNIEPILIDPVTLKYRFSTGASEQVIEIRDNGVPIYTYPSLTTGATVNLTASTFTLTYPPAGQITASIQGRKRTIDLSTGVLSDSYTDNAAKIIGVIVTEYGKVGVSNLSSTDLHLSSMSGMPTYPVGIYLGTQKQNIIDVCKQLASSVGAEVFFNRNGELQLLKIGTITGGTEVVTEDDIVRNTLSVSNRTIPEAAKKIAYCKNWTIQEGIVTGIPDAHKEMFATEWYYYNVSNISTKTDYKLHAEVDQLDTLLLTTAGASSLASSLNSYYSEPRTVYRFTSKSRLLSIKVGQGIELFHHRFGLSSGKTGQVISVSPNWVEGTNVIEVII